MTGSTELSPSKAEKWYKQFRDSEALEQLLNTADVDTQHEDLREDSVHKSDETITVKLIHDVDDSHSVIVQGDFERGTEQLSQAELNDSHVAAPLAGNGTIWRYEDGDITENRWVS